jgi:hypothetical protein
MKILAIGDIHGKTVWRQFVENVDADIIVFVGDYIIVRQWLFNRRFRMNLREILEFKRANFKRVYLLLGNHDTPFIYSDFNLKKILTPRMTRLYRDNEDCFDVAFQYQKYLFTHAGVTEGWYRKNAAILKTVSGTTFADKLNAIHRSHGHGVLHQRGKARGGAFEYGGITYADKTETEHGALQGYTQVVGHTKVQQPVRYNFRHGSVLYIDCLNAVQNCLYIDGDNLRVMDVSGNSSRLLDIHDP